MADETPVAPAAPAIDPKAIQDAIRSSLAEIAKEIPAPAPQPIAPPQPQAADPVWDAMAPSLQRHLGPMAQQLNLNAASAYDATTFYNNPAIQKEGLAPDYMQEIEKRFAQQPRQRMQIWNE